MPPGLQLVDPPGRLHPASLAKIHHYQDKKQHHGSKVTASVLALHSPLESDLLFLAALVAPLACALSRDLQFDILFPTKTETYIPLIDSFHLLSFSLVFPAQRFLLVA